MSLAATRYEHIVLKDDVPFIGDTTTKVIELVLEQQAYGWSPEELHFQHPHLSLGKIYSALAYYWDHKEDIDRDIEQRLQETKKIERDLTPSRLIDRLKAKGLI